MPPIIRKILLILLNCSTPAGQSAFDPKAKFEPPGKRLNGTFMHKENCGVLRLSEKDKVGHIAKELECPQVEKCDGILHIGVSQRLKLKHRKNS